MILPPLIALLLAPQTPAAPPAGCKKCDFRGVVACKGHRELLELEGKVDFCSEAAACKDCGGALRIDCEKCEGGPDSAAASERRAQVQEWLGKENSVQKVLGRPLPRVETPHFRLIADFPSLRDGSRKVSPHQFLHDVARDCEQVSAWILEHYGASDQDYTSWVRMWFWGDAKDHQKVMLEIMKTSAPGDFKLLGRNPMFSVWTHDNENRERLNGRYYETHSLATHSAAHALISVLYSSLWIGDWQGGWFETGAAHWYEEKVHGRTIHYCMDESPLVPNYHDGYWREPIRERLAKDGVLLPELLNRSGMQLSAEETALAWSVYDWLVQEHRPALAGILKDLKAKKEPRDAFSDNLGLSVMDAEKAWRAWVKDSYAVKEAKKRRN